MRWQCTVGACIQYVQHVRMCVLGEYEVLNVNNECIHVFECLFITNSASSLEYFFVFSHFFNETVKSTCRKDLLA